jgi:hypothetical protein
MDLEWEWPGTLCENCYFRVELWNRYNVFYEFDDTVPPNDVAWVKHKFYGYDVIDEAYDREYKWRITVVKGNPTVEKQWSTPNSQVWDPPAEYVLISEPGEMRTLYVEPGDEPPPAPPGAGGGKPPDSIIIEPPGDD